MRYTVLEALVKQILEEAGIDRVTVEPGPSIPDVPGRAVTLTPYGGPGLEVDGVFDAQSWQVRATGGQTGRNGYLAAEDIATAIDTAFISHVSSAIEGVWVPSIQRVGGAPAPLMTGDPERTDFVCNYVISSESALSNG